MSLIKKVFGSLFGSGGRNERNSKTQTEKVNAEATRTALKSTYKSKDYASTQSKPPKYVSHANGAGTKSISSPSDSRSTQKTAPKKKNASSNAKPVQTSAQKSTVKVNPSAKKRLNGNLKALDDERKKVRKFIRAGDYKNAIYATQSILLKALTTLCRESEINTDGKNTDGMINAIAEKGILTKRQITNIRELKEIISEKDGHKKFSKQLGDTVLSDIALIINAAQSIASGRNSNQSASDKSKNNNPKSSAAKAKPAGKMSFGKMKKAGSISAFNVKKEFPMLYAYIDKANLRYREKDYKNCLHEIRNALELVVEEYSKMSSIPYDKNQNLEERINALKQFGRFSEGQISDLHDVRQLGNLGSHHGSNPQASDAKNARAIFSRVIELFENLKSDSAKTANEPMTDPDYYSPSRKYYGRWSDCFTRQALSIRNEYLALKRKADEGSIEAMLDIASGFLPRNIPWTKQSLVHLPSNRDYIDPYDARYYYWILKACSTACRDWQNGKSVPLKYLPTALLEALKFAVYHDMCYRYTISHSERSMNTQYTQTENYMFGKLEINKEQFADMLLAIMEEFKNEQIISAVHLENKPQYVKFLMYIDCIVTTGELAPPANRYERDYARKKIPAKYAINAADSKLTAEEAAAKYDDFVYNLHISVWKIIRDNYNYRYKNAHPKRY